jgi:hypothetical protein
LSLSAAAAAELGVRSYLEDGGRPMYEIAKFFLEFAKDLVGLGSTLQKAKIEKRIRLAQYLENISTCLHSIGEAFSKHEEPYGLFGELEEYVRSLPNVCSGLLADTEILRFQRLLEGRAHGRAVVIISHDETSRKSEAEIIARAAGQLKALANSLKV